MFLRAAQRVVLVTTLALYGQVALAGEVPAVNGALATIETSVHALRIAEGELGLARATNDELAHRITALKRLETRGTDVALASLLEKSVAAEKELAARATLRDARRRAVEKNVADTVELIDVQIRALRPDLKSADASKRAQVAKLLKSLLADREAARATLSKTREGERALPKAWAQYEVKVEALDGPSELREKADFVEDTRDKLKRKREALERWVADARQEREIARATVNFRREVSLFDEQARTGRVAKSGEAASGTVLANKAETGAVQHEGTRAPVEPAPAFTADPAPAPLGRDNEDAVRLDDTPSPPARVAIPSAPAAAVGAPLPKSVDPTNLLNLDVRALSSNTDVTSMEALLADLDRLERFLGERATVIRQRAQTLEADEASLLRDR